jgi:uncharacterized Zn finger protein/superfamily II DNA or RNA helicase
MADHWHYEYRPAPAARAGSYRRKYGTTWWGKEFLEALQRADNSGRLSRGKTYANKGLVLNISTDGPGKISATVQGSMPQPYHISLDWKPWTESQAKAILAKITSNAAILGQLLAGQLPNSLVKLLAADNMSIFPEDFQDLGVDCDCPDWSTPCKHQAALLYVIAADIDGDPFQLFKLRGLDLKTAIDEMSGGQVKQSSIPLLADMVQDIAAPAPYRWEEDAYGQIDFGGIDDTGWRAISKLPATPSFESNGDLPKFLTELCQKTSRHTKKMWLLTTEEHPESLLPPGGELELHLDENLGLNHLSSFDEANESLLEINEERKLSEWLTRLESVERHFLDAEARTMLLFFQLARKMAEAKAYVPQLLDAGDDRFVLRYIPSVVGEAARSLLERSYALASNTLLYFSPEGEEIKEFTEQESGRQLLSAFLGMIIRQSMAAEQAKTPARRLFLLRGQQTFDLVGTEGFPMAMHRWLADLHLADQRLQPVFRVTEEDDELLVDLLIRDKNAARTGLLSGAEVQVPRAFFEWQGDEKLSPADRMAVIQLLGGLARHFPDLETYLADGGETPLRYPVAEFTPVLLQVLPTMEALGLAVLLPKVLKKLLRPSLGIRADSSSGSEAFELSGIISLDNILLFSWQAALGDKDLTEAEFKELLTSSNGLVKLQEGYAYVDPAEVAKLIAQLDSGPPNLKPHERLQAIFTEEYQGGPVRIAPALRAQIQQWRNGTPPPVPEGIKATLRPYQKDGFDWLYANSRLGFGSVIADDMGLGKTLQVITLLEQYRQVGALAKEKALVIVPTSLLGNWRREINRFAPKLREHIYHGPTRQLPEVGDYDVLLTTYGVLRSEEKAFAKGKYHMLVIDEAQAIKNPTAKQTKAIKKIKAPIKIAMSGTPVENKLLDYWSLLDFTLPKFLGSKTYFNTTYAKPIQADRDPATAARFRKLTAPFVLRRLKTDKSIISDLPDKVVQTEYCSLTADQAALYQSILDENMRMVNEAKNGIGRQGLILKLITALKQCCNHPVQFLKQGQPDFADSGKAGMLKERLASILENGDKTLIFTQYRSMGDLMVKMIREEFGVEPPFLHGGCSTAQREAMVDRFQNDPSCPIFILSIKAGGTGLNLTAANHVIHYDLWWNPAVEAQATDRAYRIGQERTVFVHRLVTENTFEDKIDQLIQGKKDLADLSVGTGETFVGRMSNAELGELMEL